jgi:hypothetical protein
MASSHRVAVAMAGQVRMMPLLLTTLRDNVLSPLAADLYMHVSTSDTDANNKMSLAGNAPSGTTAHMLEVINSTLRPRFFMADRLASWTSDRDTFYGLFVRWARLLQAIAGHEAVAQQRYDWVVRTRPDLIYLCALTPSVLEQAAAQSVLDWDFLALFPRAVADIAMMLGNRSRWACLCATKVDYCVDEALLRHRLPFLKVGTATGSLTTPYRRSWTWYGKPHRFTGYLNCPSRKWSNGTLVRQRCGQHTPWLNSCTVLSSSALRVRDPSYLRVVETGAHQRAIGCLDQPPGEVYQGRRSRRTRTGAVRIAQQSAQASHDQSTALAVAVQHGASRANVVLTDTLMGLGNGDGKAGFLLMGLAVGLVATVSGICVVGHRLC